MSMRFIALMAVVCTGAAMAQETDRVSVPLSDPSRPATVRADVMMGSITVRPHSGAEVIVESKAVAEMNRRRRVQQQAETEGLKRIDIGNTGLQVEQRENLVTVNTTGHWRSSNVNILVPASANLRLKTMTGDIIVDNVQGDVEANSMNGVVRLAGVSGGVVAHSMNGNVTAALTRTDSKPMSFSTMNGDIDVTLPADTKARLKLKNDNGDVFTDFEVKLEGRQTAETQKGEGGRYRVKFDRAMYGSINGGGPEISFTAVNGQIRVRRQK